MTGIELLEEARRRHPLVVRMLLTAYSDRELLLSAIQRGRVDDYILKPWQTDDLTLRIRHGLEQHGRRKARARAVAERDALRDDVERDAAVDPLIGLERGLASVGAMLDRIATSDATIMIRGESGTGKELVAREIHRRSARSKGPFVRTNCAAFAAGVLESELFGHEAGAFTGATRSRMGRFEQATEGTLFLDEIGDMPLELQPKLLRVLQERELERVGGNATIKIDIRVIAATHRKLEQLVESERFREDLFYRLNVVPVHLPPLRERPSDVDVLAHHFLARFARELGKNLTLSDDAIEALRVYEWPGNVRELRNIMERAAVLADEDGVLDPEDLAFEMRAVLATSPASSSIFDEIAKEEARRIEDALRRSAGNRAGAARLLGVPRTTLADRLRKLGIR
jgi:DNA-binding NtrC family response regulator